MQKAHEIIALNRLELNLLVYFAGDKGPLGYLWTSGVPIHGDKGPLGYRFTWGTGSPATRDLWGTGSPDIVNAARLQVPGAPFE